MINQKGSIYLLMGYFGSGKTTFIKEILNNQNEDKYAVIQNQFAEGQMGIEKPLIVDETGMPFSNFLELPNGCICCSAKNDLVAAIQYILENTKVRNIIVETNGLADPCESIKQFWFDENMNINGELHSIVGIFSLKKWKKIKGEILFEKEIIFCNKALISFIDECQEEQIAQLQDYIRTINPLCCIFRKNNYKIMDILGGAKIFSTEEVKKIQNGYLSKIENMKHHMKHNKENNHHYHQGIQSIFIEGNTELTEQQFNNKIGMLLWQSGFKILRIKGVICFKEAQFVYELQGVEDTFQLKVTKSKRQGYEKCKILIIGQKIQKDQLKKMLSIV